MEVWGGNTAVDNGVVMPGLDVWVFGRPYEDQSSGGDVHYLSSCASGRITRLLVADVSGHGVKVNDVAIKLRGLMRRFVNTLKQGKFVGTLNSEFASLADAGCFATAVVATYFEPTRTLTLSLAGHPRPIVYRSAERRWSVLETDADAGHEMHNLPLGVFDETTYDERKLRLGDGDLVLFYTDSVMEVRDAQGRMLGEAGVCRLLDEVTQAAESSLTPGTSAAGDADLAGGLVRRFYDRILASGGRPDDDVTLLLLRPNGVAARRGLQGIAALIKHMLGGLISPSSQA
jgi:hypothetical protein